MPKPTIPPIPDDGTVPVNVRKALTAIRDILNHLVRRASIDREATSDRWKLSLVDADIPAAIARDSEVTAAIAAQKLDDHAAADDNTDNNVSITAHGLCPKLPNDATKFLDGTGAWSVVSGGVADGDYGDVTVSSGGTVWTVDVGAVLYSDLSGVPSTFAPSAHATSHKLAGGDVILLHELGLPTGSVDFNGQQALSFRFENRTSDPGSPATGQVWLRTDL